MQFKRKIFILTFFLFPILSRGQVNIGLRAGMNFASIRFQDFSPHKRLLRGLNAGLTMDIPFDENWSFNTGLNYSGKGVIHGRTFSTGRVDSFTIRLNYIEVPLTIAYKLSPGNANSLVLSGGPTIGYGFNGRIRIIHSNRDPTIHLHQKETDQYKRLEVGINLCVGYEIMNRYGIRFDYSRSLLNIQRVEKEWNSVYGFSFFWYFRKKIVMKE
ncbi:MAG: porin family protein [Chitinophagaceae bacterium]